MLSQLYNTICGRKTAKKKKGNENWLADSYQASLKDPYEVLFWLAKFDSTFTYFAVNFTICLLMVSLTAQIAWTVNCLSLRITKHCLPIQKEVKYHYEIKSPKSSYLESGREINRGTPMAKEESYLKDDTVAKKILTA